jgi:hypothetical protein
MKNYILLLFFFLSAQAFSQEKGISYQAVILFNQELPGADNRAAPLGNQDICLKFLFKDALGVNEYEEIISTRTDPFGMINVVIGTGERIAGSSPSFGKIEWSAAPKFLDVSLDKEGLCADFKSFSSQEFTAVPFALFAANSGNITTGIQGETGLTGADGEIGSQGLTGETGIQGEIGIKGETGIQGSVGTKGDTGNIGLTGLQGTDGDAGIQGIQGEMGSQGLIGETGIQGLVGTKGDTGNRGLTGLQGTVGDAGIQGIQGETGIQGSVGTKGDTGEIGLTGSQGTVGDAGIQGIQGETGIQGSIGTKGDTGEIGLTGSQGTVGNAGIQGIQGETGIQGSIGTKGDAGNIGLTGLQGTVGDAGIQGIQGADGISASSDTFVDLSTDQTVEGNKTFAETITADISGNAVTVTTNADLTGAVTSIGNATSIADGAVTNPKLDKGNIPLSGFGVAVADIDLGANKLTGIADPVSAQDAATKNYVDNASLINSITEGDITSTNSTQNLTVSGMTLSPPLGTYLVLFNGQLSGDQTFSSTQGNQDVVSIYNDLMAAAGGVSHPLVFGSETLLPGVYDVTGALSFSGTLTLDGLGDPNSLFIIRATGAITTGVNTTLILTNQANANNIFWVSEGAISTADPTIMKGTLIANQAAVALGANTDLEGRMFAITGALTMGEGSTLIIPTDKSAIDLGVLSSFAMYTSVGAVSDCADCVVTGDVGTGLGAISGFANIIGSVYPAGSVVSNPNLTTYSIYQNGVEVLYSKRTINALDAIVSLQALISITTENTPVEIRWKVDAGETKIGSRTLSLIRSGH